MDRDDRNISEGVFAGLFGASMFFGPYAPAIGGVVTIAHVVFNWAHPMDEPKPKEKPKPIPQLTKADLEKLRDEIDADVREIFTDGMIRDHFDDVKTNYNDIISLWDQTRAGIQSTDREIFEEKGTLQDFISLNQTQSDLFINPDSSMKRFVTHCQHEDVEIKTIPLFIFTVWTYMLLGKLCLMWQLDRLHTSQEPEIVKNREILRKYRQDHLGPPDPKTHRPVDPTTLPGIPKEVQDAKKYLATCQDDSGFANYSVIIAEVQRALPGWRDYLAAVIDRIEGLIDGYENAFQAEHSEMIDIGHTISIPGQIGVDQRYTTNSKHAWQLRFEAHGTTYWARDIEDTWDNEKSYTAGALIAGQFDQSLWQTMVADVQGADKFDFEMLNNLKSVLAVWDDIIINTAAVFNDMHKTAGQKKA